MTKTLTTSSKIAATQSKEALIKAALINFIATNNRLPCPADPTKLLTASAGTEAFTAGTTGVHATCSLTISGAIPTLGLTPTQYVTGVVPWVSLGLTQDGATDGYNQLFTYQVSLTAIQTLSATSIQALSTNTFGAPAISGLEGAIAIFSTASTAPSLATSPVALNNQINYCASTIATTNFSFNPCAAVAIIISYGADGYGAYTSSGTQIPPPPTTFTDEFENANGDNFFVMHDFSLSTTNPFDDIILPLSANDLLTPLTNNGTIQTSNALLTSDFANITTALAAYAVANRNNIANCTGLGTHQYVLPPTSALLPALIASLSAANPALYIPYSSAYDPWGNPIQYDTSTGNTTITMCTPASTAYLLRSYGPDGIKNTNDDITMTVQVSQIQSIVTNNSWPW